jgi:hypothetical protein
MGQLTSSHESRPSCKVLIDNSLSWLVQSDLGNPFQDLASPHAHVNLSLNLRADFWRKNRTKMPGLRQQQTLKILSGRWIVTSKDRSKTLLKRVEVDC